jgi:glycosyltransferase involved in cell wall biosynthesis
MTTAVPPLTSLGGTVADHPAPRVRPLSSDAGLATVTVVIPTKNEAANIPWVLGRLPVWVDEVVVVDGTSVDGTCDVVRRCRPDARIVHETRRGKGAAIRAGFAAASCDIVVMIDADGSMDPMEMGRFVQAIREGADLAKGSRRIDGGGSADITYWRDLGNRGLLFTANRLFRTSFSELCYGYMAVRRTAIKDLSLVSDGFEIETEIVVRGLKAGVRIGEVASFESTRIDGQSNLRTWRDGSRVLATLLKERGRRGGMRDAL